MEVLCHATLVVTFRNGVAMAQVRGCDRQHGVEQKGPGETKGQNGVGAGAAEEVQLKLREEVLEVM